ncbi:MAG: hypothetical protein IPL35_12515 [Sphingobacteriales bacterium]|nr:hypothetical protein [Sphingobacteriales bacterium]
MMNIQGVFPAIIFLPPVRGFWGFDKKGGGKLPPMRGGFGVLREKRGGLLSPTSGSSEKEGISQKLKDPKNGLRTYKEAQQWLKSELGIEKAIQYGKDVSEAKLWHKTQGG